MRSHQNHDHPPDSGEPPVDDFTDLRALLPIEFQDAPASEVVELFVGWEAARHGHRLRHLTEQLGLPESVARQLILLAQGQTSGGSLQQGR